METERRVQVRTGFFTLGVLVAAAIAILFLTREGGLFTPVLNFYPETAFGGDFRTEAVYGDIEVQCLIALVRCACRNTGRPAGNCHATSRSDKLLVLPGNKLRWVIDGLNR